MESRKKAQEVFNVTNYVFVQKTTFEKAFPQIKSISVEITESGNGLYQGQHTSNYSGYDLSEYINCSNSICYNGGFSIGEVIREMVRKRETDKEGEAICQGHEGSPKGRRIYRKCLNEFSYNIHIDFVEENETK